ncbi:hypothetical protein B0H17DRAFT_1147367 [Mycena rosella]|uniref:Uncharacterized protein n=1 Tax=Mycena rosella TaxID=1033263 RepID=A0AAD7CLW5_MYCRO|nr:hypothetical protein B0H17DRAFT_1147367 [Mycena rosella]
MATPPWEAFLRGLPAAPGVDAAQIEGNVPAAQKQLNANILAYFTTGSGRTPFPPFASDIARRLRIVALDVHVQCVRVVYETMHGGCAAYIMDACVLPPPSVPHTWLTVISPSVAVGVLLGLAKGFDGTGISQSMNVHWHHPAPLGATLSITTASSRTRAAIALRGAFPYCFFPPISTKRNTDARQNHRKTDCLRHARVLNAPGVRRA